MPAHLLLSCAARCSDALHSFISPRLPSPQQTLEHPSNLWGVAFLPNGDLVTACSDHVARIWTQVRVVGEFVAS